MWHLTHLLIVFEKKLKKYIKIITLSSLSLVLSACGGGGGSGGNGSSETNTPAFETTVELGEAFFFDENLSANKTQSCATCHNPDNGFIDDRLNADGQRLTGSLGDDEFSIGDRNAPSLSYISQAPDFSFGQHTRFNSQQDDYEGYLGGYFYDGRARDKASQAAEPMLSEIEMGMLTMEAVVERIKEDSDYVESMTEIFGANVFDNDETAFSAVTESIAAFEESDFFSPFDSKYDLSEIPVISKAALGEALFFSQQFTNCATCHQLNSISSSTETFTGYEYHNIGVPKNVALRGLNGSEDSLIDVGLADNEQITGSTAEQRGKFKVPTLRNIAVTGPYMHNGVFTELDTVIKFYDQYLTGSEFTINPETGEAWAEPEVTENLNLEELQDGRTLDQDDVDALVCFLYTLTDAKYEHLLDETVVEDCGI